jgi:hypothetical protein
MSLEKIEENKEKACGPERRTIANALLVGGVAKATMVSLNWCIHD